VVKKPKQMMLTQIARGGIMLIRNPEVIKEEIKFYCKSKNLKIFLTEEKKIPYIAKTYDNTTQKCTWIFIKTVDLDVALTEWKNNKTTGNLYIKNRG
jgi:hypothetical protein